MTTRKLLWGMTWRGTVWGFGAGIVISSFCLVVNDILPSSSVDYYTLPSVGYIRYIVGNDIPLGILIGIIFGFPVGLAASFLLSVLTKIFFCPLRNANNHQAILAVTCTIFVFANGLFFFGLMLSHPPNHLVQNVILPCLISGAIAPIISQRLARWYERESAKGIAQNVSPN